MTKQTIRRLVLGLLIAIFSGIILLHLAGTAFAGEGPAEKTFEVSFSSKVLTKYVGDTGVLFYGGAVSQNDLTLIHLKSGIYLNAWGSVSLRDAGRETNFGNEVDYTFGWAGEVAGLAIDAGISYWDLVKVFHAPEGDIVQPYLEVGKKLEVGEKNSLTPAIKAEYGIPAKGNAPEEKGLHLHGTLKHGWQATKELTVNHKVALTYDNGAYGADHAWIGAYELGPSYKMTDSLSLDVSGKVIGPLTGVDDGRETQYIGAVGISASF